ncbi:hypothetical protein ABVT39_016835, partial [Epinephelus coioides]
VKAETEFDKGDADVQCSYGELKCFIIVTSRQQPDYDAGLGSKFEYSTLLSMYHNQDVAEIIYIVHNPVFGLLLNSMVTFQALFFANFYGAPVVPAEYVYELLKGEMRNLSKCLKHSCSVGHSVLISYTSSCTSEHMMSGAWINILTFDKSLLIK